MIQFEDVTKTYNKRVKAVDSLSFSVNKGEIVGFIGPNGSGKTTSIKMMTGILTPDSGRITVNGFDVKKDTMKFKQSIGYIGDTPGMFPRLKGIEFLDLIADIYRVPNKERQERIQSLTEKFGLTEVLSSPLLSYSHGMRQKMMVTAALLHEPPVWILDEPMTGLDPKSVYELKNMMRAHADKGNAVFFSTHVLEVAEKLCDRVIIIKNGVKLYEGTLENLEKNFKENSLEEIFLELTER